MARPWPAIVASCLMLGGCAAVPALPVLSSLAKSDQTIVSPPGQDGTRYLAVEGGALASPRVLKNRWSATARRVCEGEFQRLSESTGARKQNGITRSRIHEGFIQCILPDGSETGAPGTPTADDATGKRRQRPVRLGQR